MSCISVNDLIGCGFKTHGRTKEEGFDCYGLAIEVLKRNGITLPDLWYDNSKESDIKERVETLTKFIKIDNFENLCIIDIETYRNYTHIGVYVGEGKFVHAIEKYGVIVENVSKYRHRIKGLYKVSN